MEQDDPGEALSELRERRLGALELLQAAAGSGLAAYIAWALLLQPGFRRVPLRLQVRGGALAGGGVRGRSRTRSEWEVLPLPGGPRVGTLKAQEASAARLTAPPPPTWDQVWGPSPACLLAQVPYVGASERQVEHVLSLLRGRPGKTVDLGSGDGRIVRSGMRGGVLVSPSRQRTSPPSGPTVACAHRCWLLISAVSARLWATS